MKVVDIEKVVILMRFIQFGWTEERKKAFDEDLRMMLETQCEDLADHDKQIRDEVISDLQNLYKEWEKETHGFYCADDETTRFLKRLKTHINLEEVQMKWEQNE